MLYDTRPAISNTDQLITIDRCPGRPDETGEPTSGHADNVWVGVAQSHVVSELGYFAQFWFSRKVEVTR